MKKQAEALMPTPWGNFIMTAYSDDPKDKMPHIALVHESADRSAPVLVRIHSECLTGDLFSSNRCDCGEQLERALELASERGGAVLYLRQEGRGIGIINKLKAYNLQDEGYNTADANAHLGLPIDDRKYDLVEEMLLDLGIKSIHLLTNNPLKIKAMEASKIEVVSRVPLIIPAKKENEFYLRTKSELMGHLF